MPLIYGHESFPVQVVKIDKKKKILPNGQPLNISVLTWRDLVEKRKDSPRKKAYNTDQHVHFRVFHMTLWSAVGIMDTHPPYPSETVLALFLYNPGSLQKRHVRVDKTFPFSFKFIITKSNFCLILQQ